MSLRSQIIEIIRSNWPNDTATLTSDTIYQQLLEQGVNVPDGSMLEVLEYLKRLGLIRVDWPLHSAAARIHGGVTISAELQHAAVRDVHTLLQ